MPVQKTKPSDYPQAVIQQIELLAQNIVVARKRRKETQAQWARRLGVSQPTMARIEKGDPSVAMASYVMCMWLINPACSLADLIAPQSDLIALEREVTQARAPRAHTALRQKESRAPAKPMEGLRNNKATKLSNSFERNSLAKLVEGLKIGEATARHANVAAGLAALIAKTQGDAK